MLHITYINEHNTEDPRFGATIRQDMAEIYFGLGFTVLMPIEIFERLSFDIRSALMDAEVSK